MGASGCILKKKEDINIDQLIDDIRIAADRAGSPIIANKKVFAKDDGRFRYMAFNIFDKEKKTMFYYICLIFLLLFLYVILLLFQFLYFHNWLIYLYQ